MKSKKETSRGSHVRVAMNRTGMDVAPDAARETVDGAKVLPPSSPGSDQAIAEVSKVYTMEAEPIGSMPPPTPSKGGMVPMVLLDKLGERLAFERAGTRLYDALIAKFDALGGFDGGPKREELVHHRNEEAQHFLFVAAAMKSLGGDPTAQT